MTASTFCLALLVVICAQKTVTALISGTANPYVWTKLPAIGFSDSTVTTCRRPSRPIWTLERLSSGQHLRLQLRANAMSSTSNTNGQCPQFRSARPVAPGPVALSWAAAALMLQAQLTDWAQLDQDAAGLIGLPGSMGSMLPRGSAMFGDISAQHLVLYVTFWVFSAVWDRAFGMHKPFEVCSSRTNDGQSSAVEPVVEHVSKRTRPILTPTVARGVLPRPRAAAVRTALPGSRAATIEMGHRSLDDHVGGDSPVVRDLQILLHSTDSTIELLGIQLSDNNRVLKVAAGSSADRAGLQPLDVMIEIDGASCRSSEQIRELLAAEPRQHQTRRFVRVLRPTIHGSSGVHAPTREVRCRTCAEWTLHAPRLCDSVTRLSGP